VRHLLLPRTCRRAFAVVLAVLVAVPAFAVASAVVPGAAPPAGAALTGNDDTVYAFGSATFRGSTQGMNLASPVVGMAQTADGSGYWLVAEDGGVFGFGAPFFGSAAAFARQPVVAMAATRDGGGYWIVTEDGALFSFGTAQYHGNLVGVRLNAPITDIIPTADGGGYWLIAADGGVFSFGTARFFGSTGGMRLNAPVVSMAPVPDGNGYWLVARDGGVFSYGSAAFWGSTGGMRLNAPVIGMASAGTGAGYWLVAEDGGVFSFGTAPFYGSAVGMIRPGKYVSELRGMPAGDGYRMLAIERLNDVSLANVGASGPHVADIQRRLEAMGYWTGGANGGYGPLTQQAVWAFQKIHGLPRTGNVDPATRLAFRTATRPRPRSTSGYVAEVDKARQVVIIARNGRAEWIFNTSTGTERPYTFEGRTYLADTPPGIFTVNRQVDGVRHGELGTLYRPKYFHPDGIAFHGYPNVPPYPASHGCVRLTNAAINWVWDNNVIPLGTTVWVY
jgi:peptidoglycan hydrolase-like protein with peptidoglycan-binding domain